MKAWELRTSSHRRPLRSDLPEHIAATLLAGIQSAGPGECVILQWVVGPWLGRRPVQVGRSVGQRGPVPAWNDWLVTSEQATALRTKYKEPIFGVVARVGVAAESQERITNLRQTVIGSLQLARTPGVGFERRLVSPPRAARRLRRVQHPLIGWPCTLSATELASCLGFPIGNPMLPGVTYGAHRQLPAPPGALVRYVEVPSKRHRVTGRSTYPGTPGFVTQQITDALHHTYVLGPTGSGKSVTMGNLALSDIAAGRSVVLLDMKGDLALGLADRIPKQRWDDVVLFDAGSSRPIGFNPLKGRSEDLVVDGVLHILEERYAAHWGPRTADVMSNGLHTLVRHGGMTLTELPVLLTNPQFRRKVVSQVRDDDLGVGPFWHWFEGLSDAERAAVIGPSLNKLRAFTGRETVRRIIGQVEGFDLLKIFTERRILLANLSPGVLGSEGAELLGSLLMGSLWSLIQQRSAIPPERRHPVMLYLDEYQQLLRLPTDLGDALAQARGLGVGLVLANQNLDQLTPSIRSATLANTRSKIVFACDYDDARVMARVLGGRLAPEDLQSLGRYQTYQALCVGGVTSPPASVETLPLPQSTGSLDTIRRLSSERYGQPARAVDDEIRARRRIEPAAAPVGTRKRGGGRHD